MSQAEQHTALERQTLVDSCPRFIPLTRWNDHFDWPPQGGLRHLRFHQDTNGFKSAFKTVGSRVVIDADEFWRIVEEQEGT